MLLKLLRFSVVLAACVIEKVNKISVIPMLLSRVLRALFRGKQLAAMQPELNSSDQD